MSQESQEVQEREWAHWTEPSWLEVDGLSTAYRRQGTGPQLVYLHGAGLTRSWLPLYEELAQSFEVTVPEHPGFGDTRMPETLKDMSDLVLHYDALFDQLDLDGAHLVGHSMGGWIAANLALFYPRRFASLTLIAPLGVRVPEEPTADSFRWSPETAGEMLLNGTAGNYLDLIQQGDPVEQTLHEYSEAITFARLTWNPRYDIRFDWRLRRVAAPTLVLHPAEDRVIPRSHSERFAELIPGAEFELLEGARGEPAGHLVIIQQPGEIAARIGAHALASS
ncbi:MAG: alpha/beta hydrolase [Actinobacteria bacterium]|nr:alpha/beta hydrolase [Actinomycetota bacterium]